MNYRHGYHAGNFADVHKHLALVAILQHLAKKQKPFAVIDVHAGAGLYDLRGEEASKTREADWGIERFQKYDPVSPLLGAYLELVCTFGHHHYPGSPLIAAKMLRSGDRLVAIEKHPAEFARLQKRLSNSSQARLVEGDGYELLQRYLPPPERRGLVLIDPPYEEPDELERLSSAFANAYRRFATGIFLVWYPFKDARAIDALIGELLGTGVRDLLNLMIDVGSEASDRLSAAGLLVANPPFNLDREMREASFEILPLVKRGERARVGVEWIAGPT